MGMRAGIPRARSAARYILVALLCAAAASACGSVRASGQPPAGAAGHTSAGADSAAVRLVIEVTSPGAKPQRWTLRCDPVGGTHPHARAACNVLEHAKNPFAPVRPQMMCPATPASRTATITGTWFGHPVNATYTQTGCGLMRWRQVWQVFP